MALVISIFIVVAIVAAIGKFATSKPGKAVKAAAVKVNNSKAANYEVKIPIRRRK